MPPRSSILIKISAVRALRMSITCGSSRLGSAGSGPLLISARVSRAAGTEARIRLAGAVTGDDPEWIGYFDAAELAGEGSHCFRDLRSPRTAQGFIAQA